MSNTTAKPSIVFVTGACHTDFHLRPVVPHFEKAGYRIIPRPLHSAGNPGTFDEDVAPTHSAIEAELQAGRDVCVIVHSAGGLSGCEAVNRVLSERKPAYGNQIRMIFLASMIDWAPVMENLQKHGFIHFDFEQGQMIVPKPYEAFYEDMEIQEAQPFVDALTYQGINEPAMSPPKWPEIPLIYLKCERDRTVPPDYQSIVAREYGMREVSIDSAHFPFVSMPEKLVEIIDSALQKS